MDLKNKKKITWILFAIYFVLLIKVILFKYPTPMIKAILQGDSSISLGFRIAHNSNFIPMKTIFYYLFESDNIIISIKNILGNIIVFMPFGFLLPIATDKINKLKSIVISSLLLSLIFETIQLLTGLGEFDVDDILLNILGAVIGYMFYHIVVRFFEKQ